MTNVARAELSLLKLCLARRNCNEIEIMKIIDEQLKNSKEIYLAGLKPLRGWRKPGIMIWINR